MERRVTLRDIAEATGCHYSTVSLALRGDLRIQEQTREKILRTAQKLGYRPDPMVKALAVYREAIKPAIYHATLAWFSNARESQFHPGYIFKHYVAGARTRAEELGYKLEEFVLHEPGMTLARLPKILQTRGISGILVAPQPPHRMLTGIHMDWTRFSAVAFGYSLAWPPIHLVSNHQYRAAKIAVRKLISLGYKRVALVVGEVSNGRVDGNWLGGYLTEILHKKLDPLVFLRTTKGSETLLEDRESPRLKAWLEKNKPDALIIDYSPPFIPWLKETCGLRVPEDIGVTSLNVQSDDMIHSGIDQNESEIGSAAVDLLVNMLHTNERGIPAISRRLLIEGTWRMGETVRRINVPEGMASRPSTPKKRGGKRFLQ